MKTPHKHADIIKAWADGAEIEGLNALGEWVQIWVTTWSEVDEFRIKPESKPDVLAIYTIESFHDGYQSDQPDLMITFDGETGKLKSAEVME